MHFRYFVNRSECFRLKAGTWASKGGQNRNSSSRRRAREFAMQTCIMNGMDKVPNWIQRLKPDEHIYFLPPSTNTSDRNLGATHESRCNVLRNNVQPLYSSPSILHF